MHFCTEVWLPKKPANARDVIDAVFDGHSEKDNGGYQFYDWYQIGGRWMNNHDPRYNPDKDPRNKEKCPFCNGTGVPKSMGKFEFKRIHAKDPKPVKPKRDCPQCKGTGKATKWPTNWRVLDFVVIEQDKAPKKMTSYYLAVADEEDNLSKLVKLDEDKDTVASKLKELGLKNGFLVTVDCHS